jgi:hypothetical protein
MLKLTDLYTIFIRSASLRKNRLQLHLERGGKLRRFGEYCNLTRRDQLLFSPLPNMSHVVWSQVEGVKPPLWVLIIDKEPVAEERLSDWNEYPCTTPNVHTVQWKYPPPNPKKRKLTDQSV